MEYVRRQRLRAASQDLVSIKLNIVEIAAKYGFESQDGFCRAFRRYYGITPGEYRKRYDLNRQPNNPETMKEVHTMTYDMNIYEKLACSHSDKKEALETLDKLLELSEKAKRSGLLSLEPEIDVVQPELLKKSIQMLIDGIEPESLREILVNYTLCGGYQGKELLIRILIIEGILAIQQGAHPLILREKLSSFFGEDYIGDMQEIDAVTLTTAISGASGKIQIKVLKHVSRRLSGMLMDEMETSSTPLTSDIIDSQKRVLEIMHSLRNQGDIVI